MSELRARLEALIDDIAAEREMCRNSYRLHNAGRDLSRQPQRRPDLATWANAYEVVESKLRAVLEESA